MEWGEMIGVIGSTGFILLFALYLLRLCFVTACDETIAAIVVVVVLLLCNAVLAYILYALIV